MELPPECETPGDGGVRRLHRISHVSTDPIGQRTDIGHDLLYRGYGLARREYRTRLDHLSGVDVLHAQEIDARMIGREPARRRIDRLVRTDGVAFSANRADNLDELAT